MRYRLFEILPEELDEIEAKDCYSVGEIGCAKDLVNMSKMTADSLVLGMMARDGEIHGVAGSYRQWNGCSQLWAIFSKKSEKYPIALTKVCESLIQFAAKKQQLRRVSLTVRSSYIEGLRFAEFLKFEQEGKMWGYLPDGGDAILFARLF